MADIARPWSPPVALDTPRRRLRKAVVRDLVFLVPLVAAVIVAAVAMSPWAAAALLAGVVGVRAGFVAKGGATRSMRRQGIAYVRLGRGTPPERWRIAAYHLAPLVLLAALLVSFTGPLVTSGLYLGLLVLGWWKARRFGSDLDPLLALTGLDVWWAGDAATPSGTSGPPAAG